VVVFYLDNDVALGLQPLLEHLGHRAISTRTLGMTRARDDQQLLIAHFHGAILITHNVKDFVLLQHAWSSWPPALGMQFPTHPGILVLQQGTGIEHQAAALHALLSDARPTPVAGQLLRWRHREWRRLGETGWHALQPS
jgi:hypothetical protein